MGKAGNKYFRSPFIDNWCNENVYKSEKVI